MRRPTVFSGRPLRSGARVPRRSLLPSVFRSPLRCGSGNREDGSDLDNCAIGAADRGYLRWRLSQPVDHAGSWICVVDSVHARPLWALFTLVPAAFSLRFLARPHNSAHSPSRRCCKGRRCPARRTDVQDARYLADHFGPPIGRGVGASGLVHSDFLQIAANLGILGGLLFVLAYARASSVCCASFFHPPGAMRRLFGDQFSALLRCGRRLLAVQAMVSYPQTVLPIWFVWAMLEIWLEHAAIGKDR